MLTNLTELDLCNNNTIKDINTLVNLEKIIGRNI